MYQGKKVTAILLAGGSGSRFSSRTNKIYVEVAGKPILQYSLAALDKNIYIDEIVLVVKRGEEDIAGKFACEKPIRMVFGGLTRQESVYNALQGDCGDIVLIHDSARPMIRDAYITACIENMEKYPGSTVAVRSKDTIKLADEEGIVQTTTKRANTWIIQTPQCFHRDVLRKTHNEERDNPDITDDCMLLELHGYKVKLVEGHYTNIKVTTPEDLALAENFLHGQT